MSKPQALAWAIVAGITAICCWFIPTFSVVGTMAAAVCMGFLLLYAYKMWRDHVLVTNAELEDHKPVQITPEMTSPGSSRLFVPQPLDRRS